MWVVGKQLLPCFIDSVAGLGEKTKLSFLSFSKEEAHYFGAPTAIYSKNILASFF